MIEQYCNIDNKKLIGSLKNKTSLKTVNSSDIARVARLDKIMSEEQNNR